MSEKKVVRPPVSTRGRRTIEELRPKSRTTRSTQTFPPLDEAFRYLEEHDGGRPVVEHGRLVGVL